MNLARGGVGQSRHGEHHASLRQRRLELAPLPNRRLIGTLLVLVGTLVRVTIGTLVLVPILSVAAGAPRGATRGVPRRRRRRSLLPLRQRAVRGEQRQRPRVQFLLGQKL